jgi:hypothetical protein
MEACPICCNDYNRITRKQVECNYCHNMQCTECIKTYLMGNLEDPSCMQCKHPWTLDFVDAHLPKTWLRRDLQKHRAAILFEREKAMLPETQTILERERNLQVRILLQDLLACVDRFSNRIDDEDIPPNIRQLTNNMNELYENLPAHASKSCVTNEPEFVRNCPAEGCRGFIRNKTWCCGICQVKLCSKCEVVLDGEGGEHTCDPETIETIKLIKRDSKPCPSCKTLIFKIDGCDQMWCIQCKTAFSWVSGRIETGRIHNPEYYRWMREHNNGVVPREPGDGCPGGGEGNNETLPRAHVVSIFTKGLPEERKIMEVHMQMEHLSWMSRNTLYLIERNGNNHDLRVEFLKKRISEADFMTKLQRKEKQRRHKQAYVNIYNLVLSVAISAFAQFMHSKDPKPLFADITEICRYCDKQLYSINAQYDSHNYEAIELIRRLLMTIE